jgi:hypothetical protein
MKQIEPQASAEEKAIMQAVDFADELKEHRLHEGDLRDYAKVMGVEYAHDVLCGQHEYIARCTHALDEAKTEFGKNPSTTAVKWLVQRYRLLRSYQTNLRQYETEIPSISRKAS